MLSQASSLYHAFNIAGLSSVNQAECHVSPQSLFSVGHRMVSCHAVPGSFVCSFRGDNPFHSRLPEGSVNTSKSKFLSGGVWLHGAPREAASQCTPGRTTSSPTISAIQAPPNVNRDEVDGSVHGNKQNNGQNGASVTVTLSGRSFSDNETAIDTQRGLQKRRNGSVRKSYEKRPTIHSTLVLMRHGESMWNDLKLFTGDVDIPLTEKGIMEALAGGKAVSHIDFDMIFTSRLVRSKQTALLAMTQSNRKAVPVIIRGGYHGRGKTGDDNRLRLRNAAMQSLEQADCYMIPVYADQALNERCYGDLQGLSKEAAVQEFGAEMVQKWRRSHDTRPPLGESLMDTEKRTVRFFSETIVPRLQEGHHVLVVAHGNVLRCILSHISGLSHQEMLRLQIHTAVPYTYSYDGTSFAECCVLPPIDLATNKPINPDRLGLSSVVKKGQADSLI